MNVGCVGFSMHRREAGPEDREAGPVEPGTEQTGPSSGLEGQSLGKGKGRGAQDWFPVTGGARKVGERPLGQGRQGGENWGVHTPSEMTFLELRRQTLFIFFRMRKLVR